MEAKGTYLSYFWNTEGDAKGSKINLFHKKLAENSSLSLFLNILFCFAVIISVSSGLRAIEANIFNNANAQESNRFFVTRALAAELSREAELTNSGELTTYIKPKDNYTFTIKLRNTGTSTWTQEKTFLKTATNAFKFKHKNWLDLYIPSKLKEKTIEPGAIGTFSLPVTAPIKWGDYSGDFMLVENNELIPGGIVPITLKVVEDPIAAKKFYETPPQPTTKETPTTTPIGAPQVCSLKLRIANDISGIENQTCAIAFGFPTTGPQIRVGLMTIDQITSIKNDQTWEIYDANALLATISANYVVDFYFNKTKEEYSFDFNGKTFRTTSYLSLKNINAGIFTITSLKDSPSWNKTINYNQFLGNFEIKYNNHKKRAWLINILPLEDYVKGINETSNPDPMEYLKTMAVAARTYALYHVNTGTKHAREFFNVDAYYDQVYKGYTVQQRFPRIAEAANATAGIVASYKNELIVAAYFSRGDGTTRSFKEVWKKDVPYLIGVETPYTKGKVMAGHGVGIDATDAFLRAKKDNWTFDQLLKYYYTGINLEKIY
jgi:hypothetical protein